MTLFACDRRTDSPTSLRRPLESQPRLLFFTRLPNFVGPGQFVSFMLLYVTMTLHMIFNRHVSPAGYSRPLRPNLDKLQ